MLKRIAELLIICGFIAFLVSSAYGTIENREKTYYYYENRNFAEMPEFKKDDLMDGSYFEELESFLIDHSARRKKMTELKTEIDLNLFRRPVVNEVVVRDDILLAHHEYHVLNIKDIPDRVSRITDNLKAVSEAAEAYGGYYCYVAVPPQFYCHADDYPWYMDNLKAFADEQNIQLSESLEEAGISFLDTGPVFEEAGTLEEESSRVDNHYSIYGAFRTYRAIMQKLNEISDNDMEILSEDDVLITKVPNAYLGSYERKLLGMRNIGESLYRLDLKEPVSFKLNINGQDFPPEVYYGPADKSKRITYLYYMGGDMPCSVIDTDRPELPSILIYGDSFTNALECILYNSFDKMYSLDLRVYDEGTLTDFIKKYGPDYVVCLRDYESLTDCGGNGGK